MKTFKYFTFLILLIITSAACKSQLKQDENSEIKTIYTPSSSVIIYREETFEVIKTSNIVYGEGQSHSDWGSKEIENVPLLLDVYEPKNAPGNRPAIILIHGGGFRQGSRNHPPIVEIAEYFVSRGWVAVSIDYRLLNDYGTVPEEWRSAIEENYPEKSINYGLAAYPASRDAKAAIRWLYANADEYQISTDHISVAGGSAGASLAMMLGVTAENDFRDEITTSADPTLSTTNLDQRARVHTIIDLWGGAFNIDGLTLAYDIEPYDSTDAPMMIAHGSLDKTVDFERAEYVRNKYKETGVAYVFYELSGEKHSAWDAKVNGLNLADLAFSFIVEQQKLIVH